MIKYRHIVILIALLFTFPGFGAITPSQVLQKTTNALNNATGISATFSMSTGYNTYAGTFKTKGTKFCYVSGSLSTWYDGKTMWITNSGSKETTLMIPSPEEIRESNPLEYIKSYSKQYTPSLINQADKSKYTLKLQPKSGKGSLPTLELTVNSRNFKPVKLKIVSKGARPIIVSLSNVNYNSPIAESVFKYPKSKYPGYNLVDLR